MTPLLIALIVVAALCSVALGTLGSRVVEAERVQAHADVSALAGAVAGTDAAAAVSHANGSVLVATRSVGPVFVVEVSRRGNQAAAAAQPKARPADGT